MPMKDLSPELTLSLFLYCGILIIIITGLLFTHEFSDIGDSIHSIDEIESGSIQTYPIEFDDNIVRFDLRVDVPGVQEIDVYLVDAPDQQSEDMSQMRIIRSGVYRHDFYDAYNLHWTVDTYELGDGVLLLVVDNTDEGVVPASNGSINVITRYQSRVYLNPLFLPPTIGLIIISTVYFGLMVRYLRKIKGKKGVVDTQISSSKDSPGNGQ